MIGKIKKPVHIRHVKPQICCVELSDGVHLQPDGFLLLLHQLTQAFALDFALDLAQAFALSFLSVKNILSHAHQTTNKMIDSDPHIMR
jgi:hypothetical protein